MGYEVNATFGSTALMIYSGVTAQEETTNLRVKKSYEKKKDIFSYYLLYFPFILSIFP